MQQQARMAADQRATLVKLQAQLGDVNHAYSKNTAQALESHRREMRMIQEQTAAIREQEAEIRDKAAVAARASRAQRDSEKITAEQYRRQSAQRQQLLRQQLASLREQRLALAKQGRTSKQVYQEEIGALRRLHIEQVEQIRQQRLVGQAQLREHEKEMSRLAEERNALRARGQALMGFGSAAIATGVGMTLMGVEGVRALASMVKSQLDYQTASRRTLTQVTQTGVKLKDIEQIGIEVGKKVPAAFDDMQPALYDIFSSIDVNINQARSLLKQFAKDAVGGNSTLETATRANIAIMNAFGISVQHASKVSDFMFQLVRKGVGTYDEFAKSIGQAIPSAARLGVKLDELGGTLTFLTRYGLSTARAATSAARAYDALSNPKTADNLKKLGIQILNQKGDLKDFPVILDLMMKKMKGMNNFEKSQFLKNAFYGSGGTIQAMRFFNLVFKHMDTFHKRVAEMNRDSGSAKKAFKQMAQGPQAELQRLENDWKILRIELGKELLPVALKVVDVVDGWLKALQRLSPEQKRAIVTIAAMVSGFLAIGGAITVVVGGLAIFVGAIKNLGMTSGQAAGKIGQLALGLSIMTTGLITAYNATDQTTRSMGILMSAVGGAAAGSAFGPWGAAIGGVVGALGGLVAGLHNAKSAVKTSRADYSKLIDTYDTLTGAITGATRAAVLEQLQRSGTLKNLQTYGINTRTAINAILGEGKARKTVTSAIKNQQSYYDSLISQIKELEKLQPTAGLAGAKAGTHLTQEQQDRQKLIDKLKAEADAEKKVMDAVRQGIPDARAAHKEALQRAFAIQDLHGKLNALPKEKRIRIEAQGVFPTVKGIAKVAKQYRLTPKQLRVVIQATGVPTTIKQVKKVEKGLKDVKAVKGDITPYLNSIRAGGRSAEGEAREIGQTALKNLQDGPKKAKADLSKYQQSIKDGVTVSRGIAQSGGHSVGLDLGNGIVNGFSDSGAARRLADSAASAVAQAIAAARRQAKAHSPSVEMWNLGRDMVDGLALGIHDNSKKVVDEANRLADNTISSFEVKVVKVHNYLKGLNKKNIVPRMKDLLKDLDQAREKLKKLQQAQKAYEQQIKQGITQFGSLSSISFTDVFGNENAPDLQTIQTGLSDKLQTIKQYGHLLKKLTKAGYSNAIVRQVAMMGPEAGVPYAKALLQATPKQIKQINKMNAEITQSANQIAKQQGRQMYQAGKKAAQGLIDGLESMQHKLVKVARKMGKAILKEIRKILKMHSPSRAAMDIGFNFGDTFAKSLSAKVRDVQKASSELGQAVDIQMDKAEAKKPPYSGPPRPPAAGGAGTTHYHDNKWYINAGGQDPVAFGRKLAWEYETRFKL
jgi:TP901 family phage tail tape measure protein